MTNLVQKVEALAAEVEVEVETLWEEFAAFVRGKHAEKRPPKPLVQIQQRMKPQKRNPTAPQLARLVLKQRGSQLRKF